MIGDRNFNHPITRIQLKTSKIMCTLVAKFRIYRKRLVLWLPLPRQFYDGIDEACLDGLDCFSARPEPIRSQGGKLKENRICQFSTLLWEISIYDPRLVKFQQVHRPRETTSPPSEYELDWFLGALSTPLRLE